MQEHIPVEEVFEHLKCTREGLTAAAAQQRIDLFGYNKLEEKQVGKFFIHSFRHYTRFCW